MNKIIYATLSLLCTTIHINSMERERTDKSQEYVSPQAKRAIPPQLYTTDHEEESYSYQPFHYPQWSDQLYYYDQWSNGTDAAQFYNLLQCLLHNVAAQQETLHNLHEKIDNLHERVEDVSNSVFTLTQTVEHLKKDINDKNNTMNR